MLRVPKSMREFARGKLSPPPEGCECNDRDQTEKRRTCGPCVAAAEEKVDREGTLKIVRMRRQFEKPSAVRRRKQKVSRFSAMLAARHADD